MSGGIERTPQPSKPTEQHKPHQEGGSGAPGIRPTLNEQAKPPPEAAAHGRSECTNVQQPLERRGIVFDCAIPEVIPSPFHIRRMLRDEIVTEEQAQELEQQWLEELKTMDRRSLEGEARWWETMRDRFTKEHQQEQAQELEQQLEVIREQLRQRGVD
jgi:hypothetical protein